MKNQVQLITYVDRLAGGGLGDLDSLLKGRLAGLFGGVHVLPFFDPIDGADAGFDPETLWPAHEWDGWESRCP